ncbi:FMN-binding negative transcriptional regulator [Corticibacter populi]|uniref:FMN-binding negative transcriptional regulator n=1 Tax=Corticibacter populi TaxID=1550736 RepID=A0A3M6QU83_9BURK|nr:FMN-binding negative transcriptional regulator [Corticibacter populi]RMX06576.1 FMN-binding negative transcriptional regulator [Corticibacter populi]RZS31857.1 PaiB family negative transcriptional regulator [Corticibacter populi]
MHVPAKFDESEVDVLHQLMRAQPLATLVTLSPGGIEANHIPLHLSQEGDGSGVLRGHVAKANPLWHEHPQEAEVLAIFHGPQAYITPSWYPTKAVPTWNYAVAHAYGPLRTIHDPAWLLQQLESLTDHSETAFAERWQVADAPQDYVEKQLRAIVGIEIPIRRLIGKYKVSQNQPEKNQAGVYQGLRATGQAAAQDMAALVQSKGAF